MTPTGAFVGDAPGWEAWKLVEGGVLVDADGVSGGVRRGEGR